MVWLNAEFLSVTAVKHTPMTAVNGQFGQISTPGVNILGSGINMLSSYLE
jgi:hypothetical protein